MTEPLPPTFTLPDGVTCDLRDLTDIDVDEVLAIERAVSPCPWSKQNFCDSLASSHLCLGVWIAGELVAYAIYSRAAGEAELLLLGVASLHQGKGVASGLLGTMENWLCRYHDQLFLEVRDSNLRAISLYEGLGFHRVGQRPNYYPIPGEAGRRENALILAKMLQEGDHGK